MRKRRKLAAYGLPTTELVDAGPAREHVNRLIGAGMSVKQIAAVSGVHEMVIHTLLGHVKRARPSKRIHKDNASRLEATRLVVPSFVPVCGAARRLADLALQGFPDSHLTAVLGVSRNHLSRIRAEACPTVKRETWEAIKVLHRSLSGTVPPAPERVQKIVRTKAERAGYLPLLAYDNPDDPNDEGSVMPRCDCGKPRYARLLTCAPCYRKNKPKAA